MNVKRTFGIILTVLGITGLIYAAYLFLNGGKGDSNVKPLIVWGILGAIFFLPALVSSKPPMTTTAHRWLNIS